MNFIHHLTIVLALLPPLSHCEAQEKMGIPDIRNYTRQDYRAGSQNWGIGQDRRGIFYFANNEGMLSFDGVYWRNYPLPNHTIVRSLLVKGDRIYIGAQQEIGYFSPGPNGDLIYTSLKPLIPASDRNNFTEVWNTVGDGGQVFFRSNRKIFHYNHHKITVYDSYNWSFLTQVEGNTMAYDDQKGLLQFSQNHWVSLIKTGRFPSDVQLSAIIPIGKEKYMIATLSDGIYILDKHRLTPFVTPDIKALSRLNIYGATALDRDKTAFITNLGGCIILKNNGEFFARFSKEEGIQKNNILSIFLDRDKNIWLGLDNGIDLIAWNSAIRNIFPEKGDYNAGYSAVTFQKNLYLGTATGVYEAPFVTNTRFLQPVFRLLPGTKGQAWNVSVVDNHLLIGHNKGAFEYHDGRLQVLNNQVTGFWNFQLLPSRKYIVAGTYNGLIFFTYQHNQIKDQGIGTILESLRDVVVDGNTIWAMHPYKGLYKVKTDKEGFPIGAEQIADTLFIASNHNHLFRMDNRIVISSEKGTFEWNAGKNKFLPSHYFRKLLGNKNIALIREDAKGNYWFCENDKIGICDRSYNPARIIYLTELTGRILTDENASIYFPDSNHAIIAGEKGFFLVNYPSYRRQAKPLPLFIRSVRIQNQRKDSLLFGGYPRAGKPAPKISYAFNSLSINYAAIAYNNGQDVKYSYQLEGIDPSWSIWTEKTEKNYTNLAPGYYTFHVKAKQLSSGNIAIASFAFRILPPWYRTRLAYIVYLLGVVFLFYILYHFLQKHYRHQQLIKLRQQQKEHMEKQNELKMQYQLQTEKKEKELARIKNEKLTLELELKNENLAANAMVIVKKGEILSRLKKDLGEIMEESKEHTKAINLRRIIRRLDQEINNKEDWETFAVHFNNVHDNFLKKLRIRYPNLTQGEQKLCILLRTGMASKEIADILNISVKAIEISRYRLRKKLGLSTEENLFDFLLAL